MSATGNHESRRLTIALIAMIGGIVIAASVALIAALITAVLGGDAMTIFTVGGTTLGACLTLEIALAGLYVAARRTAP
ncbi:hypothetical protein [Actinoplanes sp. GCM10030250]|uniref:hypothetical protein n=1 Tax=Actinoplanes sp. GCM10030250 TaxID=3273376 RepID=UPI003616E09B